MGSLFANPPKVAEKLVSYLDNFAALKVKVWGLCSVKGVDLGWDPEAFLPRNKDESSIGRPNVDCKLVLRHLGVPGKKISTPEILIRSSLGH